MLYQNENSIVNQFAKPSITIVVRGLEQGGIERVVSLLSNYLVSRMFDVTILCLQSNNNAYKLDDRVKTNALALTQRPKPLGFIERNWRAYQEIRKLDSDIVISFAQTEMLLSAIAGLKIIFSMRNSPYHHYSSLQRHCINLEYKHALKIVFQTEGAQACFSPSVQRKGVIIPNPIDTESLPYWNPDSISNRFIAVGRLEKQKNFKMLIEAFIVFHKTHPQFELHIYGEGSQRDELENTINDNHANDYIKLEGFCDDIHTEISKSLCFVMSSDYEGLSNALLEALCIGVPCVSTDHPPGGARQYIVHTKNGFLTEVGDLKSMVQGLSYIADNREKAAKMGESAKALRRELDYYSVLRLWESTILSSLKEN